MNTQPAIETASAQPENVPVYWTTSEGERVVRFEDYQQVTAQRDELLAALKQAETLLEPLIRKMNIRTHFSEINTFENTIRAALTNAEQN